jgi:predicted  nucleic acid-binding Zn-ribbon protein
LAKIEFINPPEILLEYDSVEALRGAMGTAYEKGIDNETKINRLLEENSNLREQIERLQEEKAGLEEQLGVLPF